MLTSILSVQQYNDGATFILLQSKMLKVIFSTNFSSESWKYAS